MHRPSPGRTVVATAGGERVRSFVPNPLPPHPPIEWSVALRRRFDDALVALGRLDAIASLLPDVDLVLYSFVRKEAVLSSQIEGTQSSLSDLLLYESDAAPGVPLDDVREVSRCVAAIAHGSERLRGGFPLCLRLLREMHDVLLDHPRGAGKAPGEFRRSSVWIGGTRPGNAVFVPPPANEVAACLGSLERFWHGQPEAESPLARAALVHVQFETIHPFLDGNGRIGRALIVLQLMADGVLHQPLLHPSLFFKRHRALYYERLNSVRTDGDWEAWLDFFAEAVDVSATQALDTARDLLALVQHDAGRIAALGRIAASAHKLHAALQRQPVTTAPALVQATALTPATVNKALARLQDEGVVREVSERRRGRIYTYTDYLALLEAELG